MVRDAVHNVYTTCITVKLCIYHVFSLLVLLLYCFCIYICTFTVQRWIKVAHNNGNGVPRHSPPPHEFIRIQYFVFDWNFADSDSRCESKKHKQQLANNWKRTKNVSWCFSRVLRYRVCLSFYRILLIRCTLYSCTLFLYLSYICMIIFCVLYNPLAIDCLSPALLCR